MKGKESAVQILALFLKHSYAYLLTRFTQFTYAFPIYLIKTVAATNDDSRYSLTYDKVGTGRGLSIVSTWLEAYIHGRFTQ